MTDRLDARGRWSGWLTLLLLLLLGVGSTARPAGAQQARREVAVCAECHRDVDASRERALAHNKTGGLTCMTCHHMELGSGRGTGASGRDAACRGCHREQPPTHARVTKGAPGCTTCHRIHEPGPLAGANVATARGVSISQRCATCHTTRHKLHASVSKGAPLCTDCHAAHAQTPIAQAVAATSQRCAACHKDAHPSHTGKARAQLASACTSCHGENGLKLATAPQLNAACVSCHKAGLPAAPAALLAKAQLEKRRLPGCTDCHAFGKDRPLPQSALGIADRCGACHADALRAYRSGRHAGGMGRAATRDLPSCVTCHSGHQVHAGGEAEVRLAATQRCIQCHSDPKRARKYGLVATVGSSYMRDYHGATLAFRAKHEASGGQKDVLTCSDCHGPHAVARNDKAVLSAVCLRCHKDGDRKLAGAWLGHTPASMDNRPLILLVKLFYWFLIPFELIGLTLVIVFHIVDQRRKGARPLQTPGMKRLRAWLAGKKLKPVPTVQRFSLIERIEHFLSMSTFITLVVTGLPQTRPGLEIAQRIIGAFGGIGSTRLIHRIAGVLFVTLLLTHVTRAIINTFRNKRLPVMIPTRKDFQDALQSIKHYVAGAPRPKNGKFDASEKFEYWGLFLGGTLMSVTGFALIFPELFSRLVPGVLLATFRLMHGLEATFAVSVIAVWHTYGVLLRPEVFPLDTSIFTGKISVERMEEEHTEEYERLFPEAAEHGAGAEAAPEPSADEEPVAGEPVAAAGGSEHAVAD